MFFLSIKAEIDMPWAIPNARNPAAALAACGWLPIHAMNARCVIDALAAVALIVAFGGLAKIGPTVVRSIAVDVVDLKLWIIDPFASHPKPDNAVSQERILVNADPYIPIGITTTGLGAYPLEVGGISRG